MYFLIGPSLFSSEMKEGLRANQRLSQMKDFMEQQLWLARWPFFNLVLNKGGPVKKNPTVYILVMLMFMMMMMMMMMMTVVCPHVLRSDPRLHFLLLLPKSFLIQNGPSPCIYLLGGKHQTSEIWKQSDLKWI